VALFVDILDVQLQVLAWGLLAGASWVLLRFGMPRGETEKLDKGFGYAFFTIGLYAFVTGLWATFVWPLPSSYNIVLSDPYALFGIAYLALGLALIYGADLRGVMYMIAFLSLSVFIYAADIYSHHMTAEPAAAAAMYIFIALAALLSPLLTYRSTSRWFAYIEIVLLVIGALLSAYIGASATFEHTADWVKWVPFYG